MDKIIHRVLRIGPCCLPTLPVAIAPKADKIPRPFLYYLSTTRTACQGPRGKQQWLAIYECKPTEAGWWGMMRSSCSDSQYIHRPDLRARQNGSAPTASINNPAIIGRDALNRATNSSTDALLSTSFTFPSGMFIISRRPSVFALHCENTKLNENGHSPNPLARRPSPHVWPQRPPQRSLHSTRSQGKSIVDCPGWSYPKHMG